MSKDRKGGCACGSVRYELASEPFGVGWCHCRTCQLNSGAPAMAFASVPSGNLVFTKGKDKVKSFQSSDFGHRLFCGECGTPLAMEADRQPTTIDFSVATLDDPGSVSPEFHVFYSSRIVWFETTDSLPRYERSRPDMPNL
jgi:hypothetical protein